MANGCWDTPESSVVGFLHLLPCIEALGSVIIYMLSVEILVVLGVPFPIGEWFTNYFHLDLEGVGKNFLGRSAISFGVE